MADVRDSSRQRISVAGAELAAGSGLRVRPQRTIRAVCAGLVIVASVAFFLTLLTRTGDRHEVLALTRTVLAGEQVTASDLREVAIASDSSFASVPSSNRDLIVGQYAKVRLMNGSLLVTDSVQARPLVDPDQVLMSVPVPLTGVPAGLREGSRLVLIVTPASELSESSAPSLVEATVAAVPSNLGELVGGSTSSGATTVVALSVEVPPGSASLVGSAKAVAVGVLDPQAPFPAGSEVVTSPAGTENSSDAAAPTTSVVGG
jgi:hypothetical protein